MMTTTEEKLFSYLERQIELLEENLEVAKQIRDNIADLLAKLEGFRPASELKKKVVSQTQRRLSKEISRYIQSFLGMKVRLEKIYKEFEERGYKRVDIEEAIDFLKRVGRILIEKDVVRYIPSEKASLEEQERKKWKERKRKIKEAFSG